MPRPIATADINQLYLFGEIYDGLPVHHGVDFPVIEGTPVISAVTGTVDDTVEGTTGFGHYVIVSSALEGHTIYTYYAHLSSISVEEGQPVVAGETEIGKSGNTGTSTGPHLHFEIRQDTKDSANSRNPELYMEPKDSNSGAVAGFVPDALPGTYVTIDPNPKSGMGFQWATIYNDGVASHDIYGENYAIGDLPAGDYTITCGEDYSREVRVISGEVVSADFPNVITHWKTSGNIWKCEGIPGWRNPDFDDSSWPLVTLPDINWGCNNCDRYYRGNLIVSRLDQLIEVYFVSDDGIWVYVNGTYVGGGGGGCLYSGCVNMSCAQTSYIDPITINDYLQLGTNTIQAHVHQVYGGQHFNLVLTSSECPDTDQDGYSDIVCGGDDCVDSNPAVNPAAIEGPFSDLTCSDGVDNDCDTLMDEEDENCKETPPGSCSGTAEATTYRGTLAYGFFDLGKHLAYLLIPVVAVFFLRIVRRKR